MSAEIRVLMLEDTPEDAELMEMSLREAGISFVAQREQTREGFLRSLENFHPDIVLSDFRLPAFDGKAALNLVRDLYPELPVVIVTGAMGDEMAVELLKRGARDYVLKDRLARLPVAVLRALAEAEESRSRKAVERALRESEEKFRALAEHSPDEIARYDLHCRCIYANPALEELLGRSATELLGKTPVETVPGSAEIAAYQRLVEQVLQYGTHREMELMRHFRPEGKPVCSSVHLVPEFDGDGQVASVLSLGRDISALKETERQLRTLVENLPDMIFRFDTAHRYIYVSPNALRNLGLGQDAVIGRPIRQVLPGLMPDATPVVESLELALERGVADGCEATWSLPAGERSFEIRHIPELDENGRVISVLGIVRDTTDWKRASEKLRQAQRAFDYTTEGIMVTDAEADIVAVNRAFTAITGYGEAEVLGKNPRLLSSGKQDASFYQNLWTSLKTTGVWYGEIWNRRKNGEVYPEWLTISAVETNDGRVSHYVAVFSDTTSVKRSQEALDFLAHHDSLTDLPNRLLCKSRLEHALHRSKRDGDELAVLFVDLDRFKAVNDSLGHPIGDALLQTVARRMSERLRSEDTLARMGGDEFVVLLEHEVSAHGVAAVARKLIDLFVEPMRIGEHELYITASIGISLYPSDGEDADTLLRNADLAMYQAKTHGRNTFHFYSSALTVRANERLKLENALRRALEQGELRLAYQPQCDLATGALLGMEALLRWNHAELGWIAPSRFIPIAEDMGMISRIGGWVLREACLQMLVWRRQGLDVPRVAVNLSVQQLERESLPVVVAKILEETGLEANRLELEVTESMIMQQPERALAAMEGLKKLGVKLAVDDFGTGYSSLSYLKQLPLHRLKIDRSFVRDLTKDPNDEAIARAIISMGRSLGLEVLAEGVENEEQSGWLLREGCQFGQGFLFGEAKPANEIAKIWLRRAEAADPGKAGDAEA